MSHRIFFTLLVTLFVASSAARAQTGDGRTLRLTGPRSARSIRASALEGFGETVNGLGGRFGYNFNKHLALDTEFSFFPETHLGNSSPARRRRRSPASRPARARTASDSSPS